MEMCFIEHFASLYLFALIHILAAAQQITFKPNFWQSSSTFTLEDRGQSLGFWQKNNSELQLDGSSLSEGSSYYDDTVVNRSEAFWSI